MFTITCVTDTGALLWSLGDSTKTFSNILPISNTLTKLSNSVTVVLVSSSVDQFTSVATVLEAQSTLNGTVLSCRDNGNGDGPEERKTFLIAGNTWDYNELHVTFLQSGDPSEPTKINVIFKANNFTSATIYWMPPVDNYNCIVKYVVYLETDDMIFNSTTTSTSQSIGSLSHGVEYSVKVAAVDRMKRVSKNATILMTLEGIHM